MLLHLGVRSTQARVSNWNREEKKPREASESATSSSFSRPRLLKNSRWDDEMYHSRCWTIMLQFSVDQPFFWVEV
jgi:hypothetical protein